MIKMFTKLAQMSPQTRLARNLKKLLDLLVETDGDNFLRDGFDEEEKFYLRLLQTRTPEIREVAERLLNLNERYQLFLATKTMFQRTGTLPWKPERFGTDL